MKFQKALQIIVSTRKKIVSAGWDKEYVRVCPRHQTLQYFNGKKHEPIEAYILSLWLQQNDDDWEVTE